ncbi:hypothetical protein Pst134EB_028436 [Puccinia striiformis f. sp. tritici]|nr:hypothetical protein Pst134EB_028436 [Puccinia striiformis f. sp. tritici]
MQLYQALSVTGKKTKKPKKPQKFTHMACYHVLCKAEKWKQHRKWLDRKEKEEAQKSRRSTPFGDSEIGSVPSSDLPNDDPTSDASTIQSNQTVRAIGTKRAKDLAAKLREDKKFKDDMLAVHRDLATQTKSQNAILAEQQEALTTLADNSIMQTDLATVSETSRPFYKWQQMKVLEKIKIEQAEYKKRKEAKEAEEKKEKEAEEKRIRAEEKRKQKEMEAQELEDYIEEEEEEVEGEGNGEDDGEGNGEGNGEEEEEEV